MRQQVYHFKTIKKYEGGQATIEYILVLVVAVALIGGVVWQLHDAFQQWGRNYFGNYIACLLETGELPSLGHNNNNKASVCEQEFEDFSLAQGRPLIANTRESTQRGPSSSSGASTGRTPPSSQKAKSPTRPSSSQSVDGARGGGGSGRGFVASRSGRSNSSMPAGRRGGQAESEAGGSGFGASKGPQVQSLGSRGVTRVASQSRFDTARGVSGGELEGENGERPGGQVQPLVSGTLPKASQNKLIAVSKRPSPAPELDIEPLGLGGWLRYLLIAAILIVVLLVLGGQALKLRKSLEGEA